VKDNAAGQAWYDSIARQYADWGVDLIKLGCVTERPFRSSEIRQISEAIRGTGRAMVLSLSPQAPPPDSLAFVGRYAQMSRVSAEHWDVWKTPEGKGGFPVGLRDEFDLLAKWSPLAAGRFRVDPDVLADGWLGPRPAWGDARSSRLTHDEQRSELTLWAFARAPLIEGANLTRLDSFTKELMTDKVLLDIDQNALESHPVTNLPPEWSRVRVWEAQVKANGRVRQSFAFFNLSDAAVHLHLRWAELGIAGKTHVARNAGGHRQTRLAEWLAIDLPEHGCAVYSIE
jgi:alpha-galactosidase